MKIKTLLFALSAIVWCATAAAAGTWEALPDTAPAPADNPTTPDKVELGKVLFFDPRLSTDGSVSCASCHNVMEGGDDHRPTSIGVHGLLGGRNAPTVWNAAFHSVQFWDGRAATLEDQAKGPIVNPIEMGMATIGVAVDRINRIAGYRPLFDKAFGPGQTIDADSIAKAIAAYERTLITPNSRYDRYVKGDKAALNAAEQRGMQTFQDTGCAACHSGAAFNGPKLPVGVGFFQKLPVFPASAYVAKYQLIGDSGRATATGKVEDAQMWRVPTLRNLVYTAPYLHNGAVKSLDEAVRVMASAQLDKTLSDAEVADVVAFLEALTGEFPQQSMPRLPPTPGDMLK